MIADVSSSNPAASNPSTPARGGKRCNVLPSLACGHDMDTAGCAIDHPSLAASAHGRWGSGDAGGTSRN